MVSPSLDFSVYTDGSLKWQLAPSPAPVVQYWRQPLDPEILNVNLGDSGRKYMGAGYRNGPARERAVETGKTIPCVFRVPPSQQTKLSAEWLTFWRRLNPEHPDNILDTIIDDHFALTNGTADIPAFDQARICGGALLCGSVADGYLMIDSLLTSQQVPDPVTILNKPWLWYWLTEVNPKGVVTYILRTAADGTKKPVRVPVLSRLPLYMRTTWLHKLPLDFDPAGYDPRVMW